MGVSAINKLQDNKDALEVAALDYSKSGRKEALDRLLDAGKGLVNYYAKQYSGGRIIEDLVQSGYEGLIKAAKRYDPTRQVKFSTFASHYIMGEIRHEISREAKYDRTDWIIKIQVRVRNAEDQLRQEYGREPSLSEIANAVNIQEQGVAQAMLAGRVPLDDIDISSIKSIYHESFQLPIEDRILVRQAIEKLSKIQRQVVYLIFYRDLNQTQVADELGINQRRVSRILHQALGKISSLYHG
ncbi:MAG: hypothetical protein APF76_08075 [Desulfitibacter sp. BRH_c19]|nr:MAG: hypothetical protein APF76_08075 [Desulfitibacter sp. BRH_c19]